MTTTPLLPTYDDVVAAAARIAGHAHQKCRRRAQAMC